MPTCAWRQTQGPIAKLVRWELKESPPRTGALTVTSLQWPSKLGWALDSVCSLKAEEQMAFPKLNPTLALTLWDRSGFCLLAKSWSTDGFSQVKPDLGSDPLRLLTWCLLSSTWARSRASLRENKSVLFSGLSRQLGGGRGLLCGPLEKEERGEGRCPRARGPPSPLRCPLSLSMGAAECLRLLWEHSELG